MGPNEPKQIIVMRKDLRNIDGQKIRTGKQIAQGAHASLKAILNMGSIQETNDGPSVVIPITNKALHDWVLGRYTKVCVYVESEEELLNVYESAADAGLICALIKDAGLTEFGGIPTHTCCAIGPAYPDELVGITDHLKLL